MPKSSAMLSGATIESYPVANKSAILCRLNDDVLDLVCAGLCDLATADKQQRRGRREDKASLIPLSTTCKRFRTFCIPYIFQTFKLEYYAADPITLKLAFKADETLFTDALPDALASVLSTLTSLNSRLERFTLTIEPKRVDLFVAALVKRNVVFTSVRRLNIGHCADQVLDLFPNTVALGIHGLPYRQTDVRGWNTGLIEALPRLPKLQSFYLDQTSYEDEIIDALLKAIPNIKTLVLPCGIWSHFETFVSKLARFREVEVLGIADSSQLNVGFCPPRCGNAYMGPGGAELARRVRQQCDEANERVASTVFSQFLQLTELWLGSYAPNMVTMDRDDKDSRTGKLKWSPATNKHHWDKYF
ncbi:hypothetical protein BDY19DRAFT_64134 [Irpex rosettiformis]|uniref:Uncharacterized protein n=1 Tax=Irpex rosettiformis TaxID=378272 RepID=A0ACB8UL82_9APHY|nr:hypothetical protein BDY19DRAFT_64134 [Irpex rosettiformis]